jgi:hypothetical protein
MQASSVTLVNGGCTKILCVEYMVLGFGLVLALVLVLVLVLVQ